MNGANESKELKVTMNCAIELGSDPVKNAETIKRALLWGFEIIGADQQRMDLQYVNGHIFDKEQAGLAARVEPVALPEERIPSVKISTRRPAKTAEPKVASGKSENAVLCAFCDHKVRVDGKPCAGCAQRVCSNCKVWPKGLCPTCHIAKDTAGSEKGAAKPFVIKNPAPTKKKMLAKPVVAVTMCTMCKTKLWTKKCPVCTKATCTACYDKHNDSCQECATIA